MAPWVASSSRRLSSRSAISPPQMPNTSTGANCSAVVMPTGRARLVSRSTSQSWASCCIQVPLTDTSWPKKKRR